MAASSSARTSLGAAAQLERYDAAYVALAEQLDCPLTTSDAPLARSAGHRARIELF